MLKLLHVYKHPEHGNILITNIQFVSENGLNYHYEWRKVDKNGKVDKDILGGFGGHWREVSVEVILKIKFLKDKGKNNGKTV